MITLLKAISALIILVFLSYLVATSRHYVANADESVPVYDSTAVPADFLDRLVTKYGEHYAYTAPTLASFKGVTRVYVCVNFANHYYKTVGSEVDVTYFVNKGAIKNHVIKNGITFQDFCGQKEWSVHI